MVLGFRSFPAGRFRAVGSELNLTFVNQVWLVGLGFNISAIPSSKALQWERERESERERERERESVSKLVSIVTHSIDWSGHVYVNPDSWEVKAKMSSNEETGTGALGITTILR
jgi:hypothetical protein